MSLFLNLWMDLTFDSIKADIQRAVDKYIPNLQINAISITPYTDDDSSVEGDLYFEEDTQTYEMFDIYRTAGEGVEDYTAKVKNRLLNKRYNF